MQRRDGIIQQKLLVHGNECFYLTCYETRKIAITLRALHETCALMQLQRAPTQQEKEGKKERIYHQSWLTVKCKFQFRTWIGAIHFQVLVYLVFELNIEIKKTSHDFGSIQMSLGVFAFSHMSDLLWNMDVLFVFFWFTTHKNSCRMELLELIFLWKFLHAIRNDWIFTVCSHRIRQWSEFCFFVCLKMS